MTVYFDKRWKRWCYDFQSANVRHFGYCNDAEGKPVTSKSAARQAEQTARITIKIAPKLLAADAVTFGLVTAQLMPRWKRGADWSNTQRYVRELLAHFKPETPVVEIGEVEIRGYVDWALVQPARLWLGGASHTLANPPKHGDPLKALGRTRSPSTVNHYLVPLRQILEQAHAMRDPLTRKRVLEDVPPVPVLRAARRLPRPVPDNVISRVLQILPGHIAKAIFLTLYFGLRRDEVFGLMPQHVDFARGGILFKAEEVKSGRDEFLPGSVDAMAFLALLAGEAHLRRHATLIALRWQWPRKTDGAWLPIKSPKTAWTTAMKTIQKEFGAKWRWHDLRAAFITHQASTSLSGKLVQTMARHQDFATTQVYIQLADSMMTEAAERAAQRPALKLVVGGK